MVPRGIKYKVFTLILITNSRSWTEKKTTKVCLTFFFIRLKSEHFLALVTRSLMFLKLDCCDPTVWRWASCRWAFHGCLMMPQQNMFLMPEEKKIHVVNARLVKVVTWICLDFDMDLSKFWNGFVRVHMCISLYQTKPRWLSLQLHFIQCPFPNQIQFGLEKLHPKIAYNFPNQFQFGLER